MNERICVVCQDYPAFHVIQVSTDDGAEYTHYLCQEHYQQIEDPKRFFSILDHQFPQEDFFISNEIFSD